MGVPESIQPQALNPSAHTHTLSHPHSHSHTLSHTRTRTHTHTYTYSQTHTLTLTHTLTHSHTPTHPRSHTPTVAHSHTHTHTHRDTAPAWTSAPCLPAVASAAHPGKLLNGRPPLGKLWAGVVWAAKDMESQKHKSHGCTATYRVSLLGTEGPFLKEARNPKPKTLDPKP